MLVTSPFIPLWGYVFGFTPLILDSFIDIMYRDNRVSQMLREYVEPYEDGDSFHSFSGPVINCDDYL